MKKKILILIFAVIVIAIAGVILIPKIFNKEEVDISEREEEYKIIDNAIYEKLEPLNESALTNNINKINNVCEKYLDGMNIYFGLIPNKEYYLSENGRTDFDSIENFVKGHLNENVNYIGLYDELDLDCYYRTDMHWKQENIDKVVDKISQMMDLDINEETEYEEKSLGKFYGSYYKELNGESIEVDELIYLTNEMLENSVVYNVEKNAEEKIYNLDKVNETNNKYDLFLSGAAAIQNIENSEVNNGKKLILFRDSFGSSIAPLLVKNYEEILLVDIRYVNSEFLSNYIDFEAYNGQDVLFLYNTRVINKSGIFR